MVTAGFAATVVKRAIWGRINKERLRNPTAFHHPIAASDGEILDPVALVVDGSPEVGTELDNRELIELTRQVGQPLDWDLLSHHVLDGATLDDLAASLGVSRARVGQRIERARRRALEALQAAGG
jgi:DNA-directed RNA polymerase specialized sigma24 family protein